MITDNNKTRDDGKHISFQGIDIKGEFVPAFKGIFEGNIKPMMKIVTTGQKSVEQMMEYSLPIVSVLPGDAYGGGVELMAGYSIVAEGATIALPECTLDVPGFLIDKMKVTLDIPESRIKDPCCLFPGWHGERGLLLKMITEGKVREDKARQINEYFVFNGIKGGLSAQEAHENKMINEVAPREDLYEAAIQYFERGKFSLLESLGEWEAPPRPPEIVPRGSVGKVACDLALYENSGTWREVGEKDAYLMVKAMLEGLDCKSLPIYDQVRIKLSDCF